MSVSKFLSTFFSMSKQKLSQNLYMLTSLFLRTVALALIIL